MNKTLRWLNVEFALKERKLEKVEEAIGSFYKGSLSRDVELEQKEMLIEQLEVIDELIKKEIEDS